MIEFDKVLDAKEKIHWSGQPEFWPFFLSGFAGAIFGLFFMIIGGIFVIAGIMSGNFLFIFIPHFWIGVAFVFGVPLYKYLVYKHTFYAITNKRVILQKGLIGRDFEIIDFDKIANAEVNVGIMDKLFGRNSGSIIISTQGGFMPAGWNTGFSFGGRYPAGIRPYVLCNIENPYEVFKFFKKISHAVKTDIQFPNKYRPKTNPGYNSRYKGE